MPRYVALLRGINIGAKKRIAMADLKALVEGLGHEYVQTYVNSGNVVFDAASGDETSLAQAIEAAMLTGHNLVVPAVVRSGEELAEIVERNPFPQYVDLPKTLHVTFLSDEPAPELVGALARIEKGEDDYRVVGRNVYLHYPNGVSGAVFMVNGFDRALKVTSTNRNWRTVLKLAEMTSESSGPG